jgi:7-carboxy-7-deazaguanine synthase
LFSPIGKSKVSHDWHGSERGTAAPHNVRAGTDLIRIAETFTSRQGEGKLTGTESFFIRTSGCNLRCWFCDTPYASWNPEGQGRSIGSIVEQAVASTRKHVVLTGGEPLLPVQSAELCAALRAAGRHLTIETAGTLDRGVDCDLLSISPKFSSSTPDATKHPRWNRLHRQRRMPIETMKRLIARARDHQVKFVVDSPNDFDELLSVTGALGVAAGDVWVMPQGSTTRSLDAADAWLRPWCESVGFHYCDRMQIRWYGNRRGT